MTNKVDWSNAPADAQFYSAGSFRYHDKNVNSEYWWNMWSNQWEYASYDSLESHVRYKDFELRPVLDDSNYSTYSPDETLDCDESLEVKSTTKTSIQFLDEVKAIQEERAAEYEQEGGERSFAKIATVFNTYTGKNLEPSDIALILEILKNVRFYSQDGYHKDSVIDALSYTSLWAELVTQERDKR